jgi:intron-binding protein aquarius
MTKGPKRKYNGDPSGKEDALKQLAEDYWLPTASKAHEKFSVEILEAVYKELYDGAFPQRKVVFLEFSQYLEFFLWKNYSPQNTSKFYVLSIIIMVNEKFREKIPAWQVCLSSFYSQFNNYMYCLVFCF